MLHETFFFFFFLKIAVTRIVKFHYLLLVCVFVGEALAQREKNCDERNLPDVLMNESKFYHGKGQT